MEKKTFPPVDIDVDADRRKFLGTAAGVTVPAAMTMLLSTSMASPAIAASGGVVPVAGGGGSDHDVNPLLAFLGLAPVAASARPGAAPGPVAAAPVGAAAPAAAAAPWESSGGSSAPVAAPPVYAQGYGARPPVAAAGARPRAVAAPGASGTPRSVAIRKAGERG